MPNPWDNDPVVSPAPQAPAQPPAAAGTTPWTSDPPTASAAAGAPAPGGNPWDNDPVVSPAPQDTSFTGQLAHQGGLFVRGAVQAAAALPGAVSDAVTAPINAGLDLAMGQGNGFRFQHVGEALGNVMDEAGVAKPQNAPERVVQDAMGGVGSAAGGVGLGMAIERAATGPFTAAIGKMLQHAPAMQLASGATGGVAQGVAQESGASPLAQSVAGIAGAVAPSALAYSAPAAVRGVLRGGEANAAQMQQKIDTFQQATGTTPSLGQASGRPAMQAVETGLSSTLGGAGIMQRTGQRQLAAMDDAVGSLADQLSGRSTATDAGEAISQGIQRFKADFKNTQRQLYSKLDQYIPAEAPVSVASTKQAMADLNADIAGAPALSQWFRNQKIGALEEALNSDTAGAPASVHVYPQPPAAGGGLMNAPVPRDPLQVAIPEGPPTNTLPYQAVQKLRSLVGKELSTNSLTSDIPRSKWSSLYSALSDDLGSAATQVGADAQKAWQRANDYTRAGMQRLDVLDGIVSKDTPEAVFRAAMGANGEGGTRAQAIMKSLPMVERRQVAATTLKRMGLANPSNQDDIGDVFSSERFLTNYARMTPEARTAIFSGTGIPGLQQKVDNLARVASIRRDAGSAFANPSGTARLAAVMTQASTLGAALASGNLSKVAMAAAGFAAPAGAAKLATSPSFVKWAARPTVMSSGTAPAVAEAAVRGASTMQQPAAPRFADGGEVFRTYPMAAKARFQRGIDAHIEPTNGGFAIVPKFADGGAVAAPSSQAADIDARAHQAATSPQNDGPKPSQAQENAGNFRMGHLRVHGMNVSIESPEGATRSGTDPDGTQWQSTITGAHYGRIKGTIGNDGEHLDAFIGRVPSKVAHVVDQLTPDGTKFDEHKSFLNVGDSPEAAKAIYAQNYPSDWKGMGAVSSMPVAAFRAWATKGGKLKEPLAWSGPDAETQTS